MKKLWGYVVAAFSIVLGLFFYEKQKRESAEALNDNLDTKQKVQDKQGEILANEAKLKEEEDLRAKEKQDLEGKKNEDLSTSNLVDFFNKRK